MTDKMEVEKSSTSTTTEGEGGRLIISEKLSIDATNKAERLDVLEKKFEEVNANADIIKKSVEQSEKRIKETTDIVLYVTSVVMLTFIFSFMQLVLEYHADNYERYKKYSEETDRLRLEIELLKQSPVLTDKDHDEEIRNSEKEFLEKRINEQQQIIGNLEKEQINIENIKNCIKSKRYWQYEQCFK